MKYLVALSLSLICFTSFAQERPPVLNSMHAASIVKDSLKVAEAIDRTKLFNCASKCFDVTVKYHYSATSSCLLPAGIVEEEHDKPIYTILVNNYRYNGWICQIFSFDLEGKQQLPNVVVPGNSKLGFVKINGQSYTAKLDAAGKLELIKSEDR